MPPLSKGGFSSGGVVGVGMGVDSDAGGSG